jgi:hypothetical protein
MNSRHRIVDVRHDEEKDGKQILATDGPPFVETKEQLPELATYATVT